MININKIKKLSLAFLCLPLISSCQIFKTPEARLPKKLGVTIFNITNTRPAIRIDAVYYNPNSYGFTFKGGELDINMNNFFLGHVRLDTTIEVDGNTSFIVPVVIEPDFAKLEKSGIDLTDSVTISYKGDMKGSVGWFSRKVHLEYKGIHYLDLKL